MGCALLVIEYFILDLLIVATFLACIGRLRRRWLRTVLWLTMAAVILLSYTALTVVVVLLHDEKVVSIGWIWWMLILDVIFLVGCIWLAYLGLRRDKQESAPTVAGTWPRSKLVIAISVVAALNLITYSNIDLSSRLQLEALRGEAGALALSVAPPRIPDRDNAAIVYEQAFEGLLPMKSQGKSLQEKLEQWTNPGETGLDVKDPDLRQFLQDNAGRIALLHKAAAKPGCYFERDYHWPTIYMLLPEISPMRKAAKLLALDARVKAADGDMRGALQNINSMFAISQHIGAEPLLIVMLVSSSVEKIAANTLQDVLANRNLSSEDLPDIRLEDGSSYQKLLERALRMEEALRLTAFCEIGTGKMDLRGLMGEGSECPNGWLVVSLYRGFLLPGDLADHRRLSQQLRELAAKPYYEASSQLKQFNDQWNSKTTGLLTRVLMPALGRAGEVATRADALRQAVKLGLAAEQYHARNDRYPDRVDELAPDFILILPRDPFDGKPMRMERTADGLIFYSVGPDMADNHGDPFDKDQRTGDITFEVSAKQP